MIFNIFSVGLLKENPRMFRADFRIDTEISSSPYIVQAVQQYFDRRR